jgi:hypothetical protein
MTGILYIDPATWTKDTDDYFIFGEGYWAKVANATAELDFSAGVGIHDLSMRVRTGSGSAATDFLSGYKIELDGVNVTFQLDTSKPNEKRDEFGGSHIGYIKAKLDIKVAGKHVLKFIAIKQFAGFDYIDIIAPVVSSGGITQAQLDAAIVQAKTGMFTAVEKQAAYDLGFKEGEVQGITKEKAIWVDRIKPLTSVKTAADGIKAVIDAVLP